MTQHRVTFFLVVACLTTAVCGLDLVETARFNIDAASADDTQPEFIGSNPSSVAWSGSRLFVGGYNNSGTFQDLGVVEVLGATATGLVDVTSFTVVAGYEFTPNGRGVMAMDVSHDGDSLSIGYDDGLSGTPGGYAVYNTSDLSLRWSADERGSSGTAFDPGFNGVGAGTAFGAFQSGRRILRDTGTGTSIYDTTNGMIWYDGVGGTLTRDMDFDPATGDLYVRHNNFLSKATRTAENGLMPEGVINSVTAGDLINLQNLAFMGQVNDGGAVGDFLIFNDRTSGAGMQAFSDVVQIIDTDGNLQSANFAFLDGATPDTGVGGYDFDYDPASGTLAVMDFANRNVHIFEVGSTTSVDGDFNDDGIYDCLDADALSGEIVAGTNGGSFDLNGDGTVDSSDFVAWRAEAGAAQLASGNAYLPADANLDGSVDVADFNIWNSNKFTNTSAYCSGDFTLDGVVDVADFNLWNSNKFLSADTAAVPEPTWGMVPLAAWWVVVRRIRRSSRRNR